MSEAQTVKEMLKRRGFEILKYNPTEYLVFPPDWDSSFEDELYEMLKKYSFRIFIRDVIKNRKSFGVEELLKYTTREWVERYTGSRPKVSSASATPSSGSWPGSSKRSFHAPRCGG
jgi:hypothetical protein